MEASAGTRGPSVFVYDEERAARADRMITRLCEARGLDQYHELAVRLAAACRGETFAEELVRQLKSAERLALLRQLVKALK
jgi:hypothetical protein